MQLSEIYINDTVLLRDNYFEALGMINTKISKKLLVFIEDISYVNHITEDISCIICTKEISKNIPENIGVLISINPKITFYQIHNNLTKNVDFIQKKVKTKIGNNCEINKLASVSKNNVIIGDNVKIEEFVSIKENVRIGNNVIIRSGTIIGGEGFEFKRDNDLVLPVKHIGQVIIEDDVEIQQNCCIDKAIFPYDSTIIGSQTKLDNLIHIAHACKIGKRNLMAANATICGSVITGNNVWVGPSALISNGLFINDNVRIAVGAIVLKNILKESTWIGNPATEINLFFRNQQKIKNASKKLN